MHSDMFGKEKKHKQHILTVRHGDGGVMVWPCFAATGFGHLVVTESTMNSTMYTKELNVSISLTAWLILDQQQDNNPNYSSKSTTE